MCDGLTAANDEPENDGGWYGNNEPEPPPAIQIYHYHNDHLGTPNELTSQDGEVVWLADYQAWGNTAKVVWREEKLEQLKLSADELQPIRFQGQSFDTETGLHYNRFRYFDPDLGMFTTRDPIGLDGGNNIYRYAPNPTGWIDPFGLKVLYRSMSMTEYTSLVTNGGNWTAIPGKMEGKWFAEKYELARSWGKKMGHGGCTFMVVQITVADNIANQMHKDPYLDDIGPGRFATLEQLNQHAKITWKKKEDYC